MTSTPHTQCIDLSKLSDAQRRIATLLDKPLFVEAGAGSGKTYTLTKRVLWALSPESGTDHKPFIKDLSEVLIITFTHAAAREIKQRLRSGLKEAGMKEAALQVDSAWISTIHAMCKRILHLSSLDLGIDPGIKIASENERVMIEQQAELDVLMKYYHQEQRDPHFSFLKDYYQLGSLIRPASSKCNRAKNFSTLISSLRAKAALTQGGYTSLDAIDPASFDQAFSEFQHSLSHAMSEQLTNSQLTHMEEASQKLISIADQLQAFERRFDTRGCKAKDFEALCEDLGNLYRALPAARAGAQKELLTSLRYEAYALIKTFQLATLARCFPLCKEIAQAIDLRYQELKQAQALVDQNDLISMALEAVRLRPRSLDALMHQFKLVMVDEFQDTDRKQLELISILSGPDATHLATVGDAQQSIYRFRGADVGVFRAHRAQLKTVLQLQTNYRSHADILSFVSKICDGRARSAEHPGLFSQFMELLPSDDREDEYQAQSLPRIDVEMVHIPYRMEGAGHKTMAYAFARRMQAFIKAGQKAADMALLLGKTTHCDDYLDAMRSCGISCVVSGGSSFCSAPEVQIIACLLRVLANPANTKEGLFDLLTSPLFDVDEEDLLDFASMSQEGNAQAIKRPIYRGLEQMTFTRDHAPSARMRRAHEILMYARSALVDRDVSAVCLEVIKRSGWLLRLEEKGSVAKPVQANILAAIRYIHDLCVELGLGPARASREFDLWLSQQNIPPASLAGAARASVQVMTVHASKGLEFPIVFLAEWSSKRQASGDVVAFSQPRASCPAQELCFMTPRTLKSLPAAPSDFEAAMTSDHPSTAVECLYAGMRTQAEQDEDEACRLLYVGLTRAREALVLSLPLNVRAQGLRPDFAARVAHIAGIADTEPGTHEFDYGGTHPASLHVIDIVVGHDATALIADDAYPELDALSYPASTTEWKNFSLFHDGHTVPAASDTHGADDAHTAHDADDAHDAHTASETPSEAPTCPGQRTFTLYDRDACRDDFELTLARRTNGLYSYSYIHAQEAQDPAHTEPPTRDISDSRKHSLPADSLHASGATADQGIPQQTKSSLVSQALLAGSAYSEAATSLGSCFHALAQAIVEHKGRFPSDQQIELLTASRSLSPHVCNRIKAALTRWYNSDLFKRAWSYPSVLAEVPFYVPRASVYGEVLEGAFDLLCSDASAHKALVIDYKTGDRDLSLEEIRDKHKLQAKLYCEALTILGYEKIDCAFVCVERKDEDDQPYIVSYDAQALLSS